MPRIKIKDLPKDLKFSRDEMKKIGGGAVLKEAASMAGPLTSSDVLIEMFATIGDSLSAFQDAVANEAYLGTARQRNSGVARKRRRG